VVAFQCPDFGAELTIRVVAVRRPSGSGCVQEHVARGLVVLPLRSLPAVPELEPIRGPV
jgi:hypothetical protein